MNIERAALFATDPYLDYYGLSSEQKSASKRAKKTRNKTGLKIIEQPRWDDSAGARIL